MDGAAPCRFFQSPQGCFRGESCSFRHELPPGASSTDAGADNDAANANMSGTSSYASSARPCRFFSTGMGCRNGTSCPFAHIPAAPTPASMYANAMEDPLAGDYSAATGPMAVNSGGTVFFNHPGMPPPMMMVVPEQAPMPVGGEMPATENPADQGASSTSRTGRRRLKIESNPSKKNHEVISEILPVFTRDIEGPFFAIDVECVATGIGTNDRDVARIAVVNEDEQVVFDQYVKPDKEIVSYLTQLTGITESDLVGAPNLKEALVKLRAVLPTDSVIVGQSIKKDLEWLTLEKEVDYRQMFDVADLFRLPMQSTNGIIRYRYFSLRHVAKYLLGHNIQEADHDPVIDAKYAMKVFKQFRYLHESPGHRDAVYQTLLKTPRTPSFAERYPVIDGVAMRAPRKPGTSPSIRMSQGGASNPAVHVNGAATNQYSSYSPQYHQNPLLL